MSFGGMMDSLQSRVGGLFSGDGVEITVPGLGKLDAEQSRNAAKAVEVAKKYGIPEMEFLRHLFYESGLRASAQNPGGAAGIGQFLPSTAAAYGVTTEQLKNNVDLALDLAGRLLKENYESLGQDWRMAFAAYFVGPGNVAQAVQQAQTSGRDWLTELDGITAKYNQGTVTDYINKRGMGDPNARFGTTSPTSSSPTGPENTELQPPNYNDFRIPDGKGGFTVDTQGYYDAWYKYTQAKAMMDKMPQDQLGSYIDAVIDEMTAEISAGNLKVSKANALLGARIDSYKNYLNSLEGEAFKYGAPVGAEYVPGREPGSRAVTKLGLSPLRAQQATVNPLAEAASTYNEARGLLEGINVPSARGISAFHPGNPNSLTPVGPNNAPAITPPASAPPPSLAPIPHTVAGTVNQNNLQSALEELLVAGVL